MGFERADDDLRQLNRAPAARRLGLYEVDRGAQGAPTLSQGLQFFAESLPFRRLEAELKSLKSALVIVSHDRRFLADLTEATVWLDRGTTRRLDRGFAEE